MVSMTYLQTTQLKLVWSISSEGASIVEGTVTVGGGGVGRLVTTGLTIGWGLLTVTGGGCMTFF